MFLKLPVVSSVSFSWAFFVIINANAQTCCTGAVPVTGNLSLSPQDEKKAWLEIRYDHNIIDDLIANNQLLQDDNLYRHTRAVIGQLSYSPVKNVFLHAIIPYSILSETVTSPNQRITNTNSGLGDISVLASYALFDRSRVNLLAGVGLKLPTGTTRARGENDLILQPTLQIGTGTVDYIAVSQLQWTPFKDRSINVSQTIFAKFNSVSRNFAAHDQYQFGHEIVSYSAIAKQIYWLGVIQNPVLMLKYQHFTKNKIETFAAQNTGGSWWYLVPGWGFNINSHVAFNFLWEIPVYRQINGFQLTTSTRLMFSVQTNF